MTSNYEFCRKFSLAKYSTFNQKGKRKGKGPKAQKSKIYILFEYRKVILSRGVH
jgi:hypothetical protein